MSAITWAFIKWNSPKMAKGMAKSQRPRERNAFMSGRLIFRCERSGTAVIGRFPGDDDVVRMAFRHAGIGDLYKLGFLLQFFHRGGPAITHACPQTTDVLDHDFLQGAFVRYPAFNSFRNQLFDVVFHILKIAVFGAQLHGAETAHSAVGFEFPTVKYNRLTRCFLYTGK